ncbi:MAG: SMI1/KNR4 family protein [Pseudomonadota bacterium]
MAGLEIPAIVLALWASAGTPPATQEDITAIRDLAGSDLPADYVTFLETYGFVSWSGADAVHFNAGEERADIAFMLSPSEIALSVDLAADGFLPIAGDYSGHALILLQTDPPTGAVWYQYDLDDPIRVSADFAAFVSGLTGKPEPPRIEKWYGTRAIDEQTGFTLAAETREAWAAYGTGSTPEPADELESIETTLGRALPEALRTFLSTYGYVTYFGDIPAAFPLPKGSGQDQDVLSVIYSTSVLMRSLPTAAGTPLPFASTALPEGSLLIGLSAEDEGVIYWQMNATSAPVRIADDLRSFLAGLYLERPIDE